jgi:hypothetical protein
MFARVVLGLCAVTLTAGTAVAGQPYQKSGGSTDADKIVCRTERDTGTRLGRARICRTNAEWAEQRRQAKQNIERIQSSRALNSD